MKHWIDGKNGDLPENAIKGGLDHASEIYIARAKHQGDKIPGKLVPAYKKCYVAYSGEEHEKDEYQVLCNINVEWKKIKSGEKIPYNSLPAGYTKDGETLYIGRVQHENTDQLGKVQISHGKCYISYGGKEYAYRSYEILVLK